MNRKQRRILNKIANEEATSNINIMLSLGDKCLTCKKPYDKMSKEMARSWFVEVYKADRKVNLYCPECFKGKQENESKS